MLTGKIFELRFATVALQTVNGKRVAISLPEGSVILVIPGPITSARMIDVVWEDRALVMFAIDVQNNGIEIAEHHLAGTLN